MLLTAILLGVVLGANASLHGEEGQSLQGIPDLSHYELNYPQLDVIDLGEEPLHIPHKEVKLTRVITIKKPVIVKVPQPYPVPVEVTKTVKFPEPFQVEVVKSIEIGDEAKKFWKEDNSFQKFEEARVQTVEKPPSE